MRHGSHWLLRMVVCGSLAGMLPEAAAAQGARFVTVGGGPSIPVGGASRAMNAGWLAEIMGGVTLPGNTVTLRLGGSYGQNGIEALGGTAMMGAVGGGTERTLGAMAGVMVMPALDRDVVPYLLAGVGVMNSRLRGGTSFAWAAGVGATLQTAIAAFYLEARWVRTRRNGRYESMIPLTLGIRIGN